MKLDLNALQRQQRSRIHELNGFSGAVIASMVYFLFVGIATLLYALKNEKGASKAMLATFGALMAVIFAYISYLFLSTNMGRKRARIWLGRRQLHSRSRNLHDIQDLLRQTRYRHNTSLQGIAAVTEWPESEQTQKRRSTAGKKLCSLAAARLALDHGGYEPRQVR